MSNSVSKEDNIQKQNLTIDGRLPKDRPNARPFRIYIALTNHCNRTCPWCSTYSSPLGNTFITLEKFIELCSRDIQFEVQLEGGEPTLHPKFIEMVNYANNINKCTKIIIVTNGTTIPRKTSKLKEWLLLLGNKAVLKLSINHYLLDYDCKLLDLACAIKDVSSCIGSVDLVLNVRLRKDEQEESEAIINEIKKRNLSDVSNIFWLQKYGKASDRETWEEPFIVSDHFSLINPDGSDSGTNLIRRSDTMRSLP